MSMEEIDILLLEDRRADAELIERELEKSGLVFTLRRVAHRPEYLAALETKPPSLVLSDVTIPGFDGVHALRLLQQLRPGLPLIFVSGTIGEERAVELLKLGATDYVLKDRLARLAPAVTRALRETRLERERQTLQGKYENIFNRAMVGIFQTSLDGGLLTANPAAAQLFGFESPAGALAAVRDVGAQLWADPAQRNEMVGALLRNEEIRNYEIEFRRCDGKSVWIACDAVLVRDAEGTPQYCEGFLQDVTRRKEAETTLEATHRRLLAASRQAGMAEIATSVLHNIGNVLNSVGVSLSLVQERVRNSRIARVALAARLLAEHEADLAGFLQHDPQGRQLVSYLAELGEHLAGEQKLLLAEAENASTHLAHITAIIIMQQRYATAGGVVEQVKLAEVVEDALRMNAAGFERHGVELIREYDELPEIYVERHKLLQILVNLAANAKYALDGATGERRVVVRIHSGESGFLQISICDSGVGIPAENLPRIFEHGFTTRKDGHGFGLHSSALAARELGGTLQAESKGPGQGAAFVLTIPTSPPRDSEPRLTPAAHQP
jgi:PAS domain S-box-containing protein